MGTTNDKKLAAKNLLIVTTEQHFFKVGETMFVVGDEDEHFWERYLAVFDEILVLGRVSYINEEPKNAKISSRKNVRFAELPEFDGIQGLVLKSLSLVKYLNKNLILSDYVLLRIPGLLGYLTFIILYFKRKHWALEVVADPKEEADNANSLFARLLRPALVRITKYMCKRAKSVSYVTKEVLQSKYPSSTVENYSYSSLDISINPDHFKSRQMIMESQQEVITKPRLVLIGRMSKPFKGVDTALEMLAYGKIKGMYPTLDLIGGGRLIDTYIAQAKELNVLDQCTFHGEIRDKDHILNILAQADIMIHPSRREGLPRAIIEAMSMGLPVVASCVAGIPELVPQEFLVQPNDHIKLFEHVQTLASDKKLRMNYSELLFERSKFYDRKNLEGIRTSFYKSILKAK